MTHTLRRLAVFGLPVLMALLFMTAPQTSGGPSTAQAAAGEVAVLDVSSADFAMVMTTSKVGSH